MYGVLDNNNKEKKIKNTCSNLDETPENYAVLNKCQPQKNAHCAIILTSYS